MVSAILQCGAAVGGFSHCIIIKSEIVGPMPGLCKFEHDTAAVVSVAADDSHAVVIMDIQAEIFFVYLCDFFRLLFTIVMCRVFSI